MQEIVKKFYIADGHCQTLLKDNIMCYRFAPVRMLHKNKSITIWDGNRSIIPFRQHRWRWATDFCETASRKEPNILQNEYNTQKKQLAPLLVSRKPSTLNYNGLYRRLVRFFTRYRYRMECEPSFSRIQVY